MTWNGMVTKNFQRHMKKLSLNNRLLAYMQTLVIKKTNESALFTGTKWWERSEENNLDMMSMLELNLANWDKNF